MPFSKGGRFMLILLIKICANQNLDSCDRYQEPHESKFFAQNLVFGVVSVFGSTQIKKFFYRIWIYVSHISIRIHANPNLYAQNLDSCQSYRYLDPREPKFVIRIVIRTHAMRIQFFLEQNLDSCDPDQYSDPRLYKPFCTESGFMVVVLVFGSTQIQIFAQNLDS